MTDAESLILELGDGNPDAQCTALERLRRLAKQGDDMRVEQAEFGVLEAIKEILRGSHNGAKERAVILLVYLAKAEPNRDLIRDTGCLECLCEQLSSTTSSVILHNTMAALVNCSIANVHNQNAVRENGSMKLVVQMMERDSSKTRQNACWLLKKLATNNQKNRDKLRELGALERIVPLLAPDQTPEVQEHAVALLAFLLDKHTRNRMHFKDVAGGPAALTALHESALGSGSKTEEFASRCIESLGGIKKMLHSNSSVHSDRDDRGTASKSSSGTNVSLASSGSSKDIDKLKSPREPKSPRVVEPSPRRFLSPRGSPRGSSPRDKKEKRGFFRRKEKESSRASDGSSSKWVQGEHDDPILKPDGGGRHSMDEEELEAAFE